MPDLEQRIEAYLAEPREWQTHCRFQHAQYQLKIAKNIEDRKFWEAITIIEKERLQNWMARDVVWSDRDKMRLCNTILKHKKE